MFLFKTDLYINQQNNIVSYFHIMLQYSLFHINIDKY